MGNLHFCVSLPWGLIKTINDIPNHGLCNHEEDKHRTLKYKHLHYELKKKIVVKSFRRDPAPQEQTSRYSRAELSCMVDPGNLGLLCP